jgi:signal transduction histidine kinase
LARTQSIANKLTMMNMMVSFVALLLAGISFFAYDQYTFRQSLIHTLSAQAQIIGYNSISALTFNDPQSAANTLAALRNSPSIASAGLFTPDRRPFAEYTRAPGDETISIPNLPPGQLEGYWFGAQHIILVRRIVFEGKTVGLVYIRADLREADQRLKRYAAIALIVLLVSMGVAMLVSRRFRRSVARPIIGLAETARLVSRDRNYSIRAAPTAEHDELAILIDAFNDMLRQIQERDSALQKAHDELEQRVADRTRELVSANRELEAFSYSVSHDLRGPIDAVNGFTYVLQKQHGSKLDAGGQELIEHIRSAGKRMTELIEDLLNLSRVTTSVIHDDVVDLSATVHSIAESLRRNEPQRKVEFMIAEGLKARGDSRLLRIVLENLLRNSWKYTSRHPQACIEFGAFRREGRVLYFVRDDGAGFNPQNADRLFKPFQRLHGNKEFPGNGIGLATVQRIIIRHGGEVWAEAAVEKGATFFFTLEPSRSVASDAPGGPNLPA